MISRAIIALTFIACLLIAASCDTEDNPTPSNNNLDGVTIQGVVTDMSGVGLAGVALHIIYEIDTLSAPAAGSPQTIRRSLGALDSVELSNFNLIPGDREVQILWSTASETDCDHFEILRDGAVIVQILASNSATGSSYTYTDQNLHNDTTYTYSLVSVDLNGSHQTLAMASAIPRSWYVLPTEYVLYHNYPNPVQDITRISIALPESAAVTLKVYQADGTEAAILISGALPAGYFDANFNAESLANGFYEYRMTAGTSFSAHRMMLKNTTDYTALLPVPGIIDSDGNGHFEFELSSNDSVEIYGNNYSAYGAIKLQRAKIVALKAGYDSADSTISLAETLHHTLTFVLVEQ